jgi:hypothetical protein
VNAYDVIYVLGSVLILFAAIPANYIVWSYHRNLPWHRSAVGKSFMFKAACIAAFLDLALLAVFFREEIGWVILRLVMFALFGAALWWQAAVMKTTIVQARIASQAFDERRSAAEESETQWDAP